MNSQRNTFPEQGPELLNIYFARLMAPWEVSSSIEHQKQMGLNQFKKHWFLCGDAEIPMFQKISGPSPRELPMRITGFTSPAGASYCVVTHQVDAFQHRFLLPLYESQVRQCLAALATQPLGILLGRDGNDDALILDAGPQSRWFLPLLGLPNPEQEHNLLKRVVEELPMVAASLSELMAVPTTLPGVRVDSVSMSVLMPMATVAAVFGESAGALQ